MAARRVAANGCRARDEHRQEDPEQQHQQQQSDQDQFGLRVAKIHGPPQAETLRDKQSRIVGIVVKEASIPVPIIIAENGVGVLTISECGRLCPGTLRMPEEDTEEATRGCSGSCGSAGR
jgi:hypothetical protein